jgi:muramidase (phage lysozyme)
VLRLGSATHPSVGRALRKPYEHVSFQSQVVDCGEHPQRVLTAPAVADGGDSLDALVVPQGLSTV